MRDSDYLRFMSASETQFDGQGKDLFSRTSLHLSFTDHHIPLYDSNSRMGLDSQVSILESIISVRDSGVWVADVDVLKALKHKRVFRNVTDAQCNHDKGLPANHNLQSVETWEEILDAPIDRFVVRAHGNWLARLATTSVLAQVIEDKEAGRVTICGPDTCWHCVLKGLIGPSHGFIF